MKKLLPLLLIFTLLAPAVGACECCPSNANSNGLIYEKLSHDCCPEGIETAKETCSLETQNQFLPKLASLFVSKTVQPALFISNVEMPLIRLNESRAPFFNPNVPLYLSTRTLRI
ncbi:MAG: hypothetical protein HY585_00390 [Candidatus Omnitrophica bacterium]|nr:hypothetical protein [Candidatus Omnitrophota bacterium]